MGVFHQEVTIAPGMGRPHSFTESAGSAWRVQVGVSLYASSLAPIGITSITGANIPVDGGISDDIVPQMLMKLMGKG